MSALRILAMVPLMALAATGLAPSRATEPLKPFMVVVVDADTQEPIRAFDYRYHVEAASGYEAGSYYEWTPVKSDSGTVRLKLPVSCQLAFDARAPGYTHGSSYMSRYAIRADDAERQIKHTLRRGVTVTGRVIDAATSQPVAGVRVSPVVFHNPSFEPDHDRSVFSQPDGRFEIAGIGHFLGSIAFEHADYLTTHWYLDDFESGTTRSSNDITVQLEAGETIFGIVRGLDGKPVEGAAVSTRDGKSTQSADDGTFRIRGVRKPWDHGEFEVDVRKPGYMRYWRTPRSMPEDGFQITLEPLFEIRGQVFDSNGQPVKRFSVMAGPGANPGPCECAYAEVTDDQGLFSIAIDTEATWCGGLTEDGKHIEPRHWLGVWTNGHAVWEDLVAFDRAGAVVSVTLQQGVTVSGSLSGIPTGFEAGEALLVPERPPREYSSEETTPQKVGTLGTPIRADGSLRFVHVRPDTYTLKISGHGVTPRTLTVNVPEDDFELSPIQVQAAGRVVGQIFTRDGEPWGFADGVLYHPALGKHEARYFKAAEDGRFVLEDVPAGEASVGARYLGSDVIWSDLANVNVVPGGEVKVVINNPDRSQDVKFRMEIGDGTDTQCGTGTGMAAKRLVDNVTARKPAFRLVLEPVTPDFGTLPDMSDWRTPDDAGLVTLSDVPAGRYRLRVFDWLMSRGFCDGLLYETEIDVQPGAEPFRVPLGAGALTGRLEVSNKIRRMPQVIAIETEGRTHPRRARCDKEGNFCVRYLPPGEYMLFGHEDANGYCQLPIVHVSNDITDVGEHALIPGVTIRGTIHLARAMEAPTAVHARDARGATLESLDFKGQNGEEYIISNLWLGTWTLTLERDGEVLAQETVKVDTTQGVVMDLTAK